MGQKVNPIGLRLGLHRKWQSNWFLNPLNYSNFLHINYEVNKYFTGILKNSPVKAFFSHCIIAKYSLEKIYIFIFFYRLRKRKKKTRPVSFFKLKRKKVNILEKNKQIKLNKLLYIINDSLYFNKSYLNYNNIILNKKNQINIKNLPINKNFKLKRGKYTSIQRIKKSLKYYMNANISITLINLLSFVKFYLYINKKRNLLSEFERQMTNLYRYEVKLVRDAVHLTYITLLLKQPQTLARFIGYQLRRTPRNRRQTKLIQFYKKIITLVLQEQKEIYGLRIKFKGRINGRKRAKTFTINMGRLPLQTHSYLIEYGESKGITIYGTIGIKVWFFYDAKFNDHIRFHLLKYFKKSKLNKNATT